MIKKHSQYTIIFLNFLIKGKSSNNIQNCESSVLWWNTEPQSADHSTFTTYITKTFIYTLVTVYQKGVALDWKL